MPSLMVIKRFYGLPIELITLSMVAGEARVGSRSCGLTLLSLARYRTMEGSYDSYCIIHWKSGCYAEGE